MSGGGEVPDAMRAPELPRDAAAPPGELAELDYHAVLRAGRLASQIVLFCLRAGRGMADSHSHRAAMVEALMRPIHGRVVGDESPIRADELDPRVRRLVGELDEWKLAAAYQCQVGHIRAARKRVN